MEPAVSSGSAEGGAQNSSVGGAAATGDGDVMLRLLPSFVAVEGMRAGLAPG